MLKNVNGFISTLLTEWLTRPLDGDGSVSTELDVLIIGSNLGVAAKKELSRLYGREGLGVVEKSLIFGVDEKNVWKTGAGVTCFERFGSAVKKGEVEDGLDSLEGLGPEGGPTIPL